MKNPTGAQIIDYVLNGPAGRGAHPMDPDKRRATAEEVETYVYGGRLIDWSHLRDIASAAQPHGVATFPLDLPDGANEMPGG